MAKEWFSGLEDEGITDMNSKIQSPPRWENYVLEHGEKLLEFWYEHLTDPKRKVLFILGRGFDPRMCLGIEKLLEIPGLKDLTVMAIGFEEGSDSPSLKYGDQVTTNWSRLKSVVNGKGILSQHEIQTWSEDKRRRIGSLGATKIYKDVSQLKDFTDVIVDISTLPRSIYLPLVARILNLFDGARDKKGFERKNLHVWVSENAAVDMGITDVEIDEQADFVQGFRGGLDMEATAGVPVVWIPIFGEGQRTQLERINELLKPDEICPVLPSPSVNPRRGDNLILEYRGYLFDVWNVDPRNFIYASERNPFEVYRQIRKTILHYREALDPLGGCKTGLSALSSKLTSLGALLVGYELKKLEIAVGIAHIEAEGYNINDEVYKPEILDKSELFGAWLCGECYEV